MKENTKDWIQYSSAAALIASAIAMAFTSLFLTMDVGAGPLTYIGEALSAALMLYGIGIYAVNKMGEVRREIDKRFSEYSRTGNNKETGGEKKNEADEDK